LLKKITDSIGAPGAVIALLTLVGAAILLLLTDPVPQNPAYHQFADTRTFVGIPNTANVISNLLFVIAGLWGLWSVARRPLGGEGLLPRMYGTFFFAVLLTGFGSGYYHWQPNNVTLVWDRLPMAGGFMALFSIVIFEQWRRELAERLFGPLLVLGLFSVIYWHYTESQGIGDLRLYALVQFVPLVVAPLLLVLLPSRFNAKRHFVWLLLFYVAAKLAEMFDHGIYRGSAEIISGHSLKHLLAGAGALVMVFGYRFRARTGATNAAPN